MVLGLSLLYVRWQGLPWMQGLFYGIGAAVIAIIARSAVKLARMTMGKDRLLWAIFAVMALVTAWKEAEIVWLFIAGGILAMLVRAPPRLRPRPVALAVAPAWSWLLTGLHGPASGATLAKLGWFFAEAGAFV